jgi:hypothetical protein
MLGPMVRPLIRGHAAGRHRVAVLASSAALGLLVAGCGGQADPPAAPYPPTQLAHPAQLSGTSPYPFGCNEPAAGTSDFVGAEAEPYLAIDPADPHHLVAAWQQDRWKGGGANGTGSAVSFDGGRSWTRADPPLTFCSGGRSALGAMARSSDPWVAILPTGPVLEIALAFDNVWSSPAVAIVVSRSIDGGLTWSAPATLEATDSSDLTLDKESLTADPTRPGSAYATWDRLSGRSGPTDQARGPAYLARTTDGGLTWEPPRMIHDPGPDAQTISNQILVLPDGTLVDLLVILAQQSTASPSQRVAVLRSPDAGITWSAPITVADFTTVGTKDPVDGHPVRTGVVVPAAAVDPGSGALYAAWEDGRFGGSVDAIAFSRSTDGGLTWSPTTRASGAASVAAFVPSLAVTGSGKVGLGYFDWRGDVTDLGPGLWTTHWLAVSADGGTTWTEAPDGGPFDLRRAPDVPGYFLGDYMGLVGGLDTFTSLLVMTLPGTAGDRTNVFVAPPQP